MGFAVNCRHGRIVTPTFRVLLESGGFFCTNTLGMANLPRVFYCEALDPVGQPSRRLFRWIDLEYLVGTQLLSKMPPRTREPL